MNEPAKLKILLAAMRWYEAQSELQEALCLAALKDACAGFVKNRFHELEGDKTPS